VEMADHDNLFKKRKGHKLFCTVRGKGVLESIEQNLDPDFVDFKFDQYCEAASKVLEVCKAWLELTTFDEVNCHKDYDIYLEKFQKERNSIIQKYENFKENAAKVIEKTEKDDDEIESLKIMKIETEEMIKENFENFTFMNKVNNEKEETSEKMKISDFEWKDLQIEKELCDVTLACDAKQQVTQEVVFSSRSDGKILAESENKSEDDSEVFEDDSEVLEDDSKVFEDDSEEVFEDDSEVLEGDCKVCEDNYAVGKDDCKTMNEEEFVYESEKIIEMDTDLYYEKYLVPEIEGEKCKKQLKSKPVVKLHVATNQEQIFICEYCVKRFEMLKSLKVHIEAVHDQYPPEDLNKEDIFSENLIESEVSSLSNEVWKLHVATNQEENFLCEHCEKRFKKGKCPKNHIEAVHGQSPLGTSLLTRSLFCSGRL